MIIGIGWELVIDLDKKEFAILLFSLQNLLCLATC